MTMITANTPANTPANTLATKCTNITPRLSVMSSIIRAYELWRQRQTLKSLDAAALRDIGVTRAEARTEANRAIWDAPENWRL